MKQEIVARNAALRTRFGADRHSTLSLATLYFALFRGDPSTTGVEPSATGGYARVAKTNDATLWGTIGASDVMVSNVGASGEILWPVATGLYSITLGLTHWAIFDNSSGGVLWYSGTLASAIQVTGAGDQPRLIAGALDITQGA